MHIEEARSLIFLPGFSTAEEVSDLSGRGVGMDVVKTNIARLGGVIDVQSELGVGTKFTITLPITLAIISALLVRVTGVASSRSRSAPCKKRSSSTPTKSRRSKAARSSRCAVPPCPSVGSRGSFASGRPTGGRRRRKFVVVCAVGPRRLGFVDVLDGQQDIVIKALGKSLQDVKGFSGATDLGDQRVALVLDVIGLLEEVVRTTEVAVEANP